MTQHEVLGVVDQELEKRLIEFNAWLADHDVDGQITAELFGSRGPGDFVNIYHLESADFPSQTGWYINVARSADGAMGWYKRVSFHENERGGVDMRYKSSGSEKIEMSIERGRSDSLDVRGVVRVEQVRNNDNPDREYEPRLVVYAGTARAEIGCTGSRTLISA